MQGIFLRRLAAALAGALGFYALAGFILVPVVLSDRVEIALARYLGVAVSVNRATFNPFTYVARLENVLTGETGSVMASVPEVWLQFSLRQLISNGWRIRTMRIDALDLTITLASYPDDGFLGAALPSGGLSVATLAVADSTVRIVAPGTEIRLDAVNLSARDLGGGVKAGSRFSLSATVNESGTLNADGSVQYGSAVLEATVRLQDIATGDLHGSFWWHPELRLASAGLSGTGSLRLDAAQSIFIGDLSLDGARLVDAKSAIPVVSADRVRIEGLSIHSAPPGAEIDRLALSAPRARLSRMTAGNLPGAPWLDALLQGPAEWRPSVRFIALDDGKVILNDESFPSAVEIVVSDISGSVDQAERGGATDISVQGRMQAGGNASFFAHLVPGATGQAETWRIRAGELDATILSPYLARSSGWAIGAGTADIDLTGGSGAGRPHIDWSLRTAGLALIRHETDNAGGNWPLDLAVSLYQDAEGVIAVQIPVAMPSSGDPAPTLVRLGEALAARVENAASLPFGVLNALVDASETDLSRIEFQTGSAALGATATTRLRQLATVLNQRPGLRLDINGAYDPVADRDALARQQVRLHVALAASAGPSHSAGRDRLDVSDPRVISILDEFAGKRLTASTLDALRQRFPQPGDDYYAAVYEALVASEAVSTRALKSLGRFRALAIASALSETATANADGSGEYQNGNSHPALAPQRVRVQRTPVAVTSGGERISVVLGVSLP